MLSPQTVENLLETIGKQGDNKQAENQLMAFKPDPNYILCLMEVLQSSQSKMAQWVAAIEFKNTVASYWDIQTKQGYDQIHAKIIQNLLKIVFAQSGTVADLLNEGALIVAKNEFPGRWNSLPTDALSFLTTDNHNTNLRVWNLIEGITEKYSYEERSDELFLEIIEVVKLIHKKLLYYAQGYLNQLKNCESPDDLAGYLEIFSTILKIFYNINWQDLHPSVENNLQSWFTILSEVMEKSIEDKAQFKQSEVLEEKYFKCKGEAINCALLYAKKYKDDFMELIKPFANQIWKTCTETGETTKSDKVVILSLHYFKTFVENPNFLDFFKDNLQEMFFKLIIPNLMPDQTIEHTFEDEPEAFCDTLLSNKEFDDKTKNCVSFIKSLSRFQTDGVYKTCCMILKEYIDSFRSKGKVDLAKEIVCLNLVSYAPVIGFNTRSGVTSINMPKDLIKETYKKIVKPGLTPIFKLFNEKKDPSQEEINQIVTPVLFCYHIKFIAIYRMFLDPQELLEIAKFSSYLLKIDNKSLQKTTLVALFKILSMNDYKTEDTLDTKLDESSFYRRYYQNPKKIKKTIDRQNKLYTNKNVFPHINQILENVYSYSSSTASLEPEALLSLRIIFNILKEKLTTYNKGILIMFKNLFKKLKMGFAYSSIKNLVESLSLYIEYTASDKETQSKVCEELVPVINEAMSLNINDLSSLLIQIYSLIIRDYSNPPGETIKVLLNSLLNTENYTADLVSLYPSYSIFFQEIIRRDPKKLVEFCDKFMKASFKFLELRMDDAFFSLFSCIFDVLDNNDLKASGWLKFLIEGGLSIITKGGGEKEQMFNSRPLFFKELFLFICKYSLKYSFADFFMYIEGFSKGAVSKLMSSDHFHNFIEAFVKKPESSILTVGLAKLLFSEFKVLAELNLKACWDKTFVSLLRNIHRRTIGSNQSIRNRKSKNRATFYKSSERMQNSVIKDISGESGFYRLRSLKMREDRIIQMIEKDCGDDIKFVVNKIKDFLQSDGKGADFSYIPKELQEMVDKM